MEGFWEHNEIVYHFGVDACWAFLFVCLFTFISYRVEDMCLAYFTAHDLSTHLASLMIDVMRVESKWLSRKEE